MLSIRSQNSFGCREPTKFEETMQRDEQNQHIECNKAKDFVPNGSRSDCSRSPVLDSQPRMASSEKGPSFTLSRGSKWQLQSRSLGADFTPGPYDVICARGTDIWNHSGNKHFREVVKKAVPSYREVATRAERTEIVSKVVDYIRSRGNGFVKPNAGQKGEWIEVGDMLAREKVGQMLRNALANSYRSSIISKKRRRRNVHGKRADTLHELMSSIPVIERSMVVMKQGLLHGNLSNEQLLALFDQEQKNLLRNIKAEEGLLERFRQAEVSASLVLNDDNMDVDGDVHMAYL